MPASSSPPIAHDPARGRFHLELEGHQAELHYLERNGAMIIDHTGVPRPIGGRGLASQLVRAAFDHARDKGWTVVPACSYAATWVARHPEYASLVSG